MHHYINNGVISRLPREMVVAFLTVHLQLQMCSGWGGWVGRPNLFIGLPLCLPYSVFLVLNTKCVTNFWKLAAPCLSSRCTMSDVSLHHVWRFASPCLTRRCAVSDVTLRHVWRDAAPCLTWRCAMSDVTLRHVWRDAAPCLTWRCASSDVIQCDMSDVIQCDMSATTLRHVWRDTVRHGF